MTKKGLIIIFTGGRCTGKTTQANLCAKELNTKKNKSNDILTITTNQDIKDTIVLDGAFFYDFAMDVNRGIALEKCLNKYTKEIGRIRSLANVYNVCVLNLQANVNTCRARKESFENISNTDYESIDWKNEEKVQNTLSLLNQYIYLGMARYYNIEPPKNMGGIQIKDTIYKDIISSLI